MKKNLVLGVAKGYGWDILEPFVTSFVKNCPSAELVFFVDDISDFTRDRLQRAERVHVVYIPAAYKEILIIHSRWKMCADFLESYGATFEQVFTTDTRDVIFQGDVFAPFKSYSHYLGYTTDADIIGSDKIYNYTWLESCFGKAEADKLADKKIICCGTVIGTINEMKIFCRIMWDALKGKFIWGHEQATMNYLVYNNLLPIENLLEIDVEHGEIFTMAITNNFSVRDNLILRPDGKISAVVHQYNRHQETILLIDDIYHDKNFQVDLRFADTRSVIEQATCLLFANRIGDAAKLFMKKFLVTTDFSGCVGALTRLWEIAMRNPLSPASELLELSAQSALRSVNIFSSFNFEEIFRLLKWARECNHPVDPELEKFLIIALLRTAEQKLAANEREQYLFCIKMINSIEGAIT